MGFAARQARRDEAPNAVVMQVMTGTYIQVTSLFALADIEVGTEIVWQALALRWDADHAGPIPRFLVCSVIP